MRAIGFRETESRIAVLSPVVAWSTAVVPATIGLSFLITLWLWLSGGQRVVYDAHGYYELATLIARYGLFGYSIAPEAVSGALPILLQTKPNGYPVFVAISGLLSTFDIEALHAVVFAAQWLICIVVFLYAAKRVSGGINKPAIAPILFALTALNPLLLLHTTELLSDSLSASLVYLAVALALPERGTAEVKFSSMLFSFVVAALSILVRSANIAVLGALLLIWLARFRYLRASRPPARALAVVAVMTVLPFVPQAVNNYLGFHSISPFVARNDYVRDLDAGATQVKYLTVVIPGVSPQWVYANPLVPAGVANLQDLVHQRPVGYAGTLALHIFTLLDQDYPFTYVTEFDPWYRWPASVANYLFLGLAALGMVTGLLRFRATHPADSLAYVFAALSLTAAACIVIYLPPHIENRYSLPVYPLVSFGALCAATRLVELWRAARWVRLGTVAGLLAAFVVGCSWLSATLETFRYQVPMG